MPIIKYRHFFHLASWMFRRTRRGGTRALPSSSRGWLGPPFRAGPPRQWLPAHSMLGSASRRGLGTVSSVGNKKRMTGSSFLPTPPRPSPVGEGAQERYLTKPAMRAMLFTQERGPPSRMNFSRVQRGGWASFFLLFSSLYSDDSGLSRRPPRRTAG